MRRFTTPTHVFQSNLDLRGAQVYVTYAQGGQVVLEKSGAAVEIAAEALTVRLTQADTGRLDPRYPTVKIQIRYVFPDGTAGASNIMAGAVEDVLKDGVIEP